MFNKSNAGIIIATFTLFLFFGAFSYAHASLRINEFVSDPVSGAEWIELLNTSSSEVDLTGWKWTELASPGADGEHEGSSRSLSGTIPPGGFLVFEANSALNNSGDSIALYEGSVLVDRVTFGSVTGFAIDLDAPGKGKSGAYIGSGWKTDQEATKGAANPATASSETDHASETDTKKSTTAPSSASASKADAPAAPPQANIVASVRTLAYRGIPLQFQGKVTRGAEQEYHGRYFWNFGDGDFREAKVIHAEKFTHTYFYPGEYTVRFEYYPDFFAETPEAVEEMIITVIEPEISITNIGDEKDLYVELSNDTDYDVDISNWILSSASGSFIIPKNTMIGKRKKLVIPGKVTHFSAYDGVRLKLMTPEREIISEYPAAIAKKTDAISRTASAPEKEIYAFSPENPVAESPAPIAYADIEAGSLIADALGPENSDRTPSYMTAVFAAIFIAMAAGAVYVIRQSGVVAEPGSDFEILDE